MTGDEEWMKFYKYFQIYNLNYYQVKKIILVSEIFITISMFEIQGWMSSTNN